MYSKKNKQNLKTYSQESRQNQNGDKAYNLLSKQEKISINKAKKMIDNGLISVKNRRVEIAREIFPKNTKFDIMQPKCEIIFEDSNFFVIDKGVGIESYSLEVKFSPFKLINRLDKDTSGIILMAKNDDIHKLAVQEFKAKKVDKTYIALVSGKIYDDITINKPISTIKNKSAKSKIESSGKEAISIIKPLRLINNSTLVEVKILTGRTHQIRVHLASINHPIIGDILYNKSDNKAHRMMLHCQKTSILSHEFISNMNIDKEFKIL